THAGQEEAVLGAIREGARGVIAWPLPGASDVARVLAPYINAFGTAGGAAADDDAVITPPRPIPRPPTFSGPGVGEQPATKPFMRAAPSTRSVPAKPPASSSDDEFDDAR